MSFSDEDNNISQSEKSQLTPNTEIRPLSLAEKLWKNVFVRKLLVIVLICALWEVYAGKLNNQLIFPTFSSTVKTLFSESILNELPGRILVSLQTLSLGYGIGIVIALLLSALAALSRFGNDILETLTAMFNPLPAIALLPLSLLWFGIGSVSITFVITHSVLWPIALSTHSGFSSISQTLRMVGRNYGLRGPAFVINILIPGALPGIITGLKNGWAFAWRTLIAAELVFGVSSGGGGLGWFIYAKKNQLEIEAVFAGLLSVILIGIFVENIIFRLLEKYTIKRWGMKIQ